MDKQRISLDLDFSQRADYPLRKSAFGIFNSGLVHPPTYERDAEHLAAAHPEHCRIDIGWGAEWMDHPHPVTVVGEHGLDYDFQDLDAIAHTLQRSGIRPYWSYCYVPEPYRPQGGSWRDLADLDGWAAMVGAYASGAQDRGVRVGYHEVYNEPDLRDERTGEAVFYSGGLEDYLEMYRRTASALRKVDPQTPVGGPALALVHPDEHWIPRFLDAVLAEALPLDFFSFHHYGTYTLGTAVEKVLHHLDQRPELAEVEAHLNEYNSFPIDYPRGGLQDSYLLAAALLADFARLLAVPGLTMTSWAQFLDSGHDNYSGMIGIDGDVKPVFHAYRLYQQMPVDRYSLSGSSDPGVGGMIAAEPGRACALLWNRSSTDAVLELLLSGLPFPVGSGRLVRIDSDHDGAQAETLDVASSTVTLELARGASLHLELLAENRTERAQPYGEVTRVRRRYPRRATAAWGDVDEASTTFRLGTAGAPDDVPVLAAHLTGGAPQLRLEAFLTDYVGQPLTGSLSVRVESPGHAVMTYLGNQPAAPVVDPSWVDTGVTATSIGAMPAGGLLLDLAAHSLDPNDLTVTVQLAGCGAGTFAELRLAPAAAPSTDEAAR